jgi:hypothetical protein
MEHEASVTLQPVPHVFVLVGSIVVHDEMERNFAGELLVQRVQELEKLLMAMALVALANHLPL